MASDAAPLVVFMLTSNVGSMEAKWWLLGPAVLLVSMSPHSDWGGLSLLGLQY